MTVAIETHQLSKRYGKKTVVNEVSFKVSPGEVYALVGPNGAGKTTVIRLVTGLAFPSSGTVRLLGEDPHEAPTVRRKLGAVVEAPAAFYPYLTGKENLALHAKLAGNVPDERITDVLDMMGLIEAMNQKTGVYSLGMRQRLGVAAALLTKPELLILDEPASGMDPLSLHLVHSVLQKAASAGTAVLLSTHHLDEVVAYCSTVAILEEGRLIDEVNILERRERYRAKVSDVNKAEGLLRDQPFVKQLGTRRDYLIFTLSHAYAMGNVTSILASEGITILELGPDIFNLRAYYQERISSHRDVKVPEVSSS